MRTRHYFAAGNTAKGFINYFDYILGGFNGGESGFLYILKGGPGTGKSTLIKKTGTYFEENGLNVEYFRCASDPASLDGVFVKELNAAVVDGTAPHVTECKIAGVCDEIINLGEFIGDSVKGHKTEIENLLKEKKLRFNLVNHYLKAAGEVYAADMQVYAQQTQQLKAKEKAGPIIKTLPALKGNIRKLFLSALDDTDLAILNDYKNIIRLEGNPYENRLLLEEIAAQINQKGYRFTFFSNLLCPELPEALEIGDTLITTPRPQNALTGNLLNLAAESLIGAREFHKQIESYYIPAMDFEGLNHITEKLIKKIEARG